MDLKEMVRESQARQEQERRGGVEKPDIYAQYQASMQDPDVQGDAPTDKDVELTESDDYLPYLADIDRRYDLTEQALFDQENGVVRPQGQISNQFAKPGVTVHGIDVATGERLLDRDSGIPQAEAKYESGVSALRNQSFDLQNGYDANGMEALTQVAEGTLLEDKEFADFERTVDQMNVPPEQAQLAWEMGNMKQDADITEQAMNDILPNVDPQPPEGPPLQEEDLLEVEGWLDASRLLYEQWHGKPFEGTDEELSDYGVKAMQEYHWNLAAMAMAISAANNNGPEAAQALLNMVDTYGRLDFDLGRVPGNIIAAVADPANYVSFGGALAARAISNRAMNATARAILAGIVAGAVEGGTTMAGISAGEQTLKITTGERENIDLGEVGVSGALGAGFGATLGGGLVGGAYALPYVNKLRQTMLDNWRNATPVGPLGRQTGALGDLQNLVPFAPNKTPGGNDRVPTRSPWAKASYEDFTQPLTIDINTVKAVSDETLPGPNSKDQRSLLEKMVGLMEEYPHLSRHPDPNASDLERAIHLRDQMVDNLLWLHDQMDPELRDMARQWYDSARNVAVEWADRYGHSNRQVAAVIAALSPEKDWYQNVAGAEKMLDIWRDQQNFIPDSTMASMGDSLYKRGEYGKLKGEKKRKWDYWKEIRGKSLDDILNNPDDPPQVQNFKAGMWMRAYDEAHNEQMYRVWAPDGTLLDFARNKDGSASKFAWGYPNTMARAVQALRDGSWENISDAVGGGHKVRNFYNNIIAPNSNLGEITSDTHATAAALFDLLSGSSPEVIHNLGGGVTQGNTGIKGTYAIVADAYREAARLRGILPREMQSITWEEIRAIFPDTFKAQKKNSEYVRKVWQDYKDGIISQSEAREKVYDYAIQGRDEESLRPTWARPDRGSAAERGSSTYREGMAQPES